MRTITATASLVVVLALSTPLSARPRTREPITPRTPDTPIVRTIKQVVKQVFGITLTTEISTPKP